MLVSSGQPAGCGYIYVQACLYLQTGSQPEGPVEACICKPFYSYTDSLTVPLPRILFICETFSALIRRKTCKLQVQAEVVHLVSTTSEGQRREDTPPGSFSRAVAYTPAPAEGLAKVLGL